MSAPPTYPNCIILLMFGSCAFLYRSNDHCAAGWTIVQLTLLQRVSAGFAVYCKGKFYCSEIWEGKLHVIDPFLQKAASQLVMRYPYRATTNANWFSLYEAGGELFSVLTFGSGTHLRYRVFKANLLEHEWVRVETFDNHALFHYSYCSILLLATDVGCKRNSIYAFKACGKLGNEVFTCGAFDLATGEWTEVDTLTYACTGPWFLPTLDSANPARTND